MAKKVSKIINITKNQDIPTEETLLYLKQLSQCLQNILTIIKVHSVKEYYYDKQLEHFYMMERENLPTILRNQTEGVIFSFGLEVLRDDLLTNEYETQEVIENIQLAKKGLVSLLAKIQREREKSPGYIATTGLEDGPLKDYIISLVKEGKKYYTLSLLGVKVNLTNEGNDIVITNEENHILTNNDNEIISVVIDKEKILKFGSKKVNIGPIKNIPNKFWEILSPTGTHKTIETVFLATNPVVGKFPVSVTSNLTISEKKEILKSRFKELQRKTSRSNLKLSLKFNDINHTTYIDRR